MWQTRCVGTALTNRNWMSQFLWDVTLSLDTWFQTFWGRHSDLIFKGRYFRNQSCMPEEIKSRLNSGNCYCSLVQIFCRLICQLKTKIYRTIIVLVILYYGCQTWFLTSREEHRSRVFENRMLMRIFVSEGKEVTVGWRKLHSEELHFLLPTNQREWDGWGIWYFAGKRGRATAYLMGKPKEEVGADGWIILKRIFKTCNEKLYTGLILLGIGTYGGLLFKW